MTGAADEVEVPRRRNPHEPPTIPLDDRVSGSLLRRSQRSFGERILDEPAFLDAAARKPTFRGQELDFSSLWQLDHSATGSKLSIPDPTATPTSALISFAEWRALLGEHGTMGLIATNTIAQGDTRATGLQPLLSKGLIDLRRDRVDALAGRGRRDDLSGPPCEGRPTSRTCGTSRSTAFQCRHQLASPTRNRSERIRYGFARTRSCSFRAHRARHGFHPHARRSATRLIAKDPKNAERIFPYLGGQEVNTSPTQDFRSLRNLFRPDVARGG